MWRGRPVLVCAVPVSKRQPADAQKQPKSLPSERFLISKYDTRNAFAAGSAPDPVVRPRAPRWLGGGFDKEKIGKKEKRKG